ncbi:MAG: hypothetical protein ACLPYS_20860 [Vulcanimicrobiaceae bacterium]
MRSADVRSWLVIPVSLLLLAVVLPTATLGVRSGGTLGLRMDRWSGTVDAVAPNSPAARAGIAAGQNIVSSSISPFERIRLLAPSPGESFTFAVTGRGGARQVSLRAVVARAPYSPLEALLIASEVATSALFILIGTGLFVFRPGWMTFWLYLYCIGTVPLDALEPFYTFLPEELLVPFYVIARTLFSGFSALPLLPFVLRFPSDAPAGWERRALEPVTAVVVVGLLYYGALAYLVVTTFVPDYRLLDDVPALGAYLTTIVLLVASYVRHDEANRQRLKIAIWGMTAAFVALSFDYLPGLPTAIYPISNTLALVMPVSIAYAVIKYRVFDVTYFVNRAVVFTAFTSGLVVLVGLLEWLTGTLIEERHLARALTAATSILIGVLLDKVHQRAERLLERLVFRKRFHAQEYLERIARSLVEAASVQAVHEALAREPREELALTSAATFALVAERRTYRRVYAIGWDERTALELDADDLLVRVLRADLATLRFGDIRWQRADLPPEPRTPVIAVPVVLGRDLLGFTLYGPHDNATDIDPEEAEILERLAAAAALAYTRVVAHERKRELDELRAKFASPVVRRGAFSD